MQVCPSRQCVAGRARSVDGSFCRGTDIVKAIAAAPILSHRPPAMLALRGGRRPESADLELLEDEVIRCLVLGVRSFRRTRQVLPASATPTNLPMC